MTLTAHQLALASKIQAARDAADAALDFAHRHKLRVPQPVARARRDLDQAHWQLLNEKPGPTLTGAPVPPAPEPVEPVRFKIETRSQPKDFDLFGTVYRYAPDLRLEPGPYCADPNTGYLYAGTEITDPLNPVAIPLLDDHPPTELDMARETGEPEGDR